MKHFFESALNMLRIRVFKYSKKVPLGILDITKELFSLIPEVNSIYSNIDDDVFLFWVFTSNQAYDDALLGEMLDKEIKIMDMYPNHRFLFHYTRSFFFDNNRDVVGEDAKIIFERQQRPE